MGNWRCFFSLIILAAKKTALMIKKWSAEEHLMLLGEKLIWFKLDNTYFGGGGESANCPKLNLWLKANVVSCFVRSPFCIPFHFFHLPQRLEWLYIRKQGGGCTACDTSGTRSKLSQWCIDTAPLKPFNLVHNQLLQLIYPFCFVQRKKCRESQQGRIDGIKIQLSATISSFASQTRADKDI